MLEMLNNKALMEQLAQDPEYKDLLLKFQTRASEALHTKAFFIESLGVSLTLPQVAQQYQGLKAIGGFFYGETGETATIEQKIAAEETRRNSWAYAVSQECLAVIKDAGFKADAAGIKAIIAFA
jgi:hypothetical protein